MYQLRFDIPAHVHFIGIGGISMSGLAEILLSKGFTVSGSDSKSSQLTDHLSKKGAVVFIGQSEANIISSTDLVVFTAAIKEDNPEYTACVSLGIPMLSRAELLGQIMDNFKNSVAISGTHGKTTTTSMIGQILVCAETDPTLSVGGILKSIQGNIRIGNSDIFVTEACEYTNSFLHFHPLVEIILNIEAEHLDFFKDLDDVRNSFRLFAKNTKSQGTLIINHEIEGIDELTSGLSCQILTYGFTEASDFAASAISFDILGHGSYTLQFQGKELGRIELHVPGIHNISNSLAAYAAAHSLGLSFDVIRQGFAEFTGPDRRFELKGFLANGAMVVDDYSHHPTEVHAALSAASAIPGKRIVCVFQPHTYSRTKAFLEEFAEVLSMADLVILTDIYAARELNTYQISTEDLYERMLEAGTNVLYMKSFDDIELYLKKNSFKNDLLITMGAGDVVTIGEHLLNQ
ncbi:MAG: UDP-N-acetylmuramate--L-alanine ligase [Lachnospiraceae bacterium]